MSDLIDVLKSLLDTSVAISQLMNVAREFLTESKRCGVLGVSSSNLDDVVELSALGIKNISKSSEFGKKVLVDLENSSDVHHGGERVI